MFASLMLAAALAGPMHVVPAAGAKYPSNCGAVPSGTTVLDPPEVRSHHGLLNLTLYVRGQRDPSNLQILCFIYKQRTQHGQNEIAIPPTLHVAQGERIILTLVNELLQPARKRYDQLEFGPAPTDDGGNGVGLMCGQPQLQPTPTPNPDTGRIYGYHRPPWNEMNLHFHGLNVSPKQPSDDVVNVLLCPRKDSSDPAKSYTYVLDIPRNEPPGLYWYHPHAHGESNHQLLLGLTGAIIVDPLAPSVPQQLPNRVFVVRDQVLNGEARPNRSVMLAHANVPDFRDLRRLALRPNLEVNDGAPDFNWRFGNPAPCPNATPSLGNFNSKELTINEVPLPLNPNKLIGMPSTTIPAGQTQFWRVANTSAETILDLDMSAAGKQVQIQVVTRDGVPLIMKNGQPTWQAVPMDHVVLAPASRVEFYVTGTAPGTQITLRTRKYWAGCYGDLAYRRDMMVVNVTSATAQKRVFVPKVVDPVPTRFSDLARVTPTRSRVFVFTEYNRKDEPEPDFYITEISNPKAVETPFTMDEPPAVVAKNGTVEDWTILNYTQETHAFHIHQIHFLVLQGAGIEAGSNQLLDTVTVPFGVFKNGGKHAQQMTPGMVKLRMDFRGDIVGTFVYHCHILEHEDGGMMAKIRVER